MAERTGSKVSRRAFLAGGGGLALPAVLRLGESSAAAAPGPLTVLFGHATVARDTVGGLLATVGVSRPSMVRLAFRAGSDTTWAFTPWVPATFAEFPPATARCRIPGVVTDGRDVVWYAEATEGDGAAVVQGPIAPTGALSLRSARGWSARRGYFLSAFGSCSNLDPVPAYKIAAARRPHLWFGLGDFVYSDGFNERLQTVSDRYKLALSLASRQIQKEEFNHHLAAACPGDWLPDDHDYGNNDAIAPRNADGSINPAGSLSPDPAVRECRQWSMRAYADLFPSFDYSPTVFKPSWWSRTAGPIRLIRLDQRINRDPKVAPFPSGLGFRSSLGAIQHDFLLENLSRPEPVKLVLAPMGFTFERGPAGNKQISFEERTFLYDFIGDPTNGCGQVIVCCGDRHAAALWQRGNIVECLANPLNQPNRHPLPDVLDADGNPDGTVLYRNATPTTPAPSDVANQMFGLVKVRHELGHGEVTTSIVNALGSTVAKVAVAF